MIPSEFDEVLDGIKVALTHIPKGEYVSSIEVTTNNKCMISPHNTVRIDPGLISASIETERLEGSPTIHTVIKTSYGVVYGGDLVKVSESSNRPDPHTSKSST